MNPTFLALLVAALSASGARAEGGGDLSLFQAELKLASTLSLTPHHIALAQAAFPGQYRPAPERPAAVDASPAEQRRARLFLAFGSGMLVSAPLHIALMSQASCDGVPTASYTVGSLMGAAGLIMTIAGAKLLAPREQRRRTSAARKFGLAVLALVSLTASELLLFTTSSSDMMCSD